MTKQAVGAISRRKRSDGSWRAPSPIHFTTILFGKVDMYVFGFAHKDQTNVQLVEPSHYVPNRDDVIAMVLARLYVVIRLQMKSRSVDALVLHTFDFKLCATLGWSMTKFAVPAALERLSMGLGQVLYFGLIVSNGSRCVCHS